MKVVFESESQGSDLEVSFNGDGFMLVEIRGRYSLVGHPERASFVLPPDQAHSLLAIVSCMVPIVWSEEEDEEQDEDEEE